MFQVDLDQGLRPLWRVGIRQKVAIKRAEKMILEEMGTNGCGLYLQSSLGH